MRACVCACSGVTVNTPFMCVHDRERVCVHDRERVCVHDRERVCVHDRERVCVHDRERVCVHDRKRVCVHDRERVCVHVCAFTLKVHFTDFQRNLCMYTALVCMT